MIYIIIIWCFLGLIGDIIMVATDKEIRDRILKTLHYHIISWMIGPITLILASLYLYGKTQNYE